MLYLERKPPAVCRLYVSSFFKARTTKTSHDGSCCFLVGTHSQGRTMPCPYSCMIRTIATN